MMDEIELTLDERNYSLLINKQVALPPQAPRLVIVAYRPNQLSQNILRVCIQAIQRFTQEPHELWVVDNNSQIANVNWLQLQDQINIVLNRTEPIPPNGRSFWRNFFPFKGQRHWGSYANAIALEIAVRLIDPQSKYLMTLHMDTMPCHPNWLNFLKSKVDEGFGSAGVRVDKIRTVQGVLHVLGNLIDFQLFQTLNLDFLPHLPKYDVGDQITVKLREAGYKVYACRNTLWEPEFVNMIQTSSPLRNFQVDRAFDDEGNVIFLHLGRGVKKTLKMNAAGVSPKEWIRYAEKHIID